LLPDSLQTHHVISLNHIHVFKPQPIDFLSQVLAGFFQEWTRDINACKPTPKGKEKRKGEKKTPTKAQSICWLLHLECI
jgi:hypothetical protein